MMDLFSLPNELLEYIFSLLSTSQHFQCHRVCKSWQQSFLLNKATLYHTITFMNNASRAQPFFNSLIYSAKCNPTSPIGHHIKRIHITVKEIQMTLQRFIILQKLCPFIEHFDYIQASSNQSYEAIPGWPHLKSISHIYGDPFHKLMNHYANQLTHLEVTPHYQSPLPFMPCLQFLTLIYKELSFNDFTNMFTTFPQLKSLTLENCVLLLGIEKDLHHSNSLFLPKSSSSPCLPSPLPLKSLTLKTVDIIDHQWLYFFGSNYPLLESLYINGAYTLANTKKEQEEYIHAFTEMILYLKQLKTLQVIDAGQICHKHTLVRHWIRTASCQIENFQLEKVNVDDTEIQRLAIAQQNGEFLLQQYSQFIDCIHATLKSIRLTTQTISFSNELVDFISPFRSCIFLSRLFLDVGDIEGKYSEWQPVDLPMILETCQHLLYLTIKHGPISTIHASSPSLSQLFKSKLIQLELIGCSFDSSMFMYLDKVCRGLIHFSIQWQLGECPLPWRITSMGIRSLDIGLPNIGLETLTLHIPLIVDQGYIGHAPLILLLASEQYHGLPQRFRLVSSHHDTCWRRMDQLTGQEGLIQVSCRYVEELIF
ncbi:unnamed protein product [Cunninghamella echinulata]